MCKVGTTISPWSRLLLLLLLAADRKDRIQTKLYTFKTQYTSAIKQLNVKNHSSLFSTTDLTGIYNKCTILK